MRVTIRVPATTANLGPGFDSLGVALNLYNEVTVVAEASKEPLPDFFQQAMGAFWEAANEAEFPASICIAGDVPRSRGLGSSVTVRLGIVMGLNALCGEPLSGREVCDIVIKLEGHPDNAVPGFYGCFAACSESNYLTAPVDPRLKFVTIIPSDEIETTPARGLLPSEVPFRHAVENLCNVSVITAAFFAKQYESLQGVLDDNLHQPYRAKLMPYLFDVIAAAKDSGALGGYLSGSGATIVAPTLEREKEVLAAMASAAAAHSITAQEFILTADNEGAKVLNVE